MLPSRDPLAWGWDDGQERAAHSLSLDNSLSPRATASSSVENEGPDRGSEWQPEGVGG